VILNKTPNAQRINSIVQISCLKPLILTTRSALDSYPSNFYLRQYKPSETDLDPIFVKVLLPNSTVISKNLHFLWQIDLFPWPFAQKSIIPNSVFVDSTQDDAVHFVTCAPLEQRKFLSLLGYISAFDLATWMVILFSVVLSILSWNYIIVKTKTSSFSAVFIPKILLGQGTNDIQYVRLITGAWVLAGLVLTNNYQGNNIDQLTSPFSPKKFETFSEVLEKNFTVYSLPLYYDLLQLDVPNRAQEKEITPESNYEYYSYIWNPSEVTFGKLFLNQKSKNTTTRLSEVLKRFVKIPVDFSDMLNMLPFKYYVDAISKCKQDIFADTLTNVLKLRSNLLKVYIEDSHISQSKVAFGQMYQFWKIGGLQIPAEEYARRRFGLIESGIIYLWKGWKIRSESWNDTVEAEKQISSGFKPISIESNVVVVFYIDLALKFLCLCIFLCECIKYLNISFSQAAELAFTELRMMCVRCLVGLKTIVEGLKM